MAQIPVEHVTDTAFLVAWWRGQESQKPDAKFKDPYAALLAEPMVAQLKNIFPFYKEGEWLLTVRTCLLDESITERIILGADTVINLAAGLDSRPYRLNLPKNLRWIEVDFPEIIQYKSEKLKNIEPKCQLERIALDLNDKMARQQLFSYLDSCSRKTLVITEGLLPYLDSKVVIQLASDLYESKMVDVWLTDIVSPLFFNWFQKKMLSVPSPNSGKVKFKFAPEEGPHYFEPLGWKVEAFNSFRWGGFQFNRSLPLDAFADIEFHEALNEAGVALLKKDNYRNFESTSVYKSRG